jgi:hypothetical protein
MARLIIGDDRTDVLAALRALLRRMTVPITLGEDESEENQRSERREAQRRRAANRAVNRVITHVRFLSACLEQLNLAGDEQGRTFLMTSFAAIALSWHHLLRARATRSERERLADAGVRAVNALSQSERARALLRHPEVAGPLVLAVSAFAEASAGQDLANLQRVVRILFHRGPREMLAAWQRSNADLLGILSDSGDLESWATEAFAIFGIPRTRVALRQRARWGHFLLVHDADQKRSPDAARLLAEANQRYGDDEVWRHYKQLRDRARILFAQRPVCGACFQQLPSSKERAFKSGDPVICRCGAILFFGDDKPLSQNAQLGGT